MGTAFRLPCKGLSALLALILCAITLFCPAQVQAYGNGFAPVTYQTELDYGQGIYFAPYVVHFYDAPGFDANIIDTLRWQPEGSSSSVYSVVRQAPISPRNHFVCFYPQLDIAMLSVVGENGNGWAEVIYNHATGQTAWVPLDKAISQHAAFQNQQENAVADAVMPRHFGKFQSWLEFMKLNAKVNGIYWLDGVDAYDRHLRSKPEDGADFIETTYLKNIKVLHARGNWLLIEGKDFGNKRPIGWVRWRDEEGKLMIFTDFTHKARGVITTPSL